MYVNAQSSILINTDGNGELKKAVHELGQKLKDEQNIRIKQPQRGNDYVSAKTQGNGTLMQQLLEQNKKLCERLDRVVKEKV